MVLVATSFLVTSVVVAFTKGTVQRLRKHISSVLSRPILVAVLFAANHHHPQTEPKTRIVEIGRKFVSVLPKRIQQSDHDLVAHLKLVDCMQVGLTM